jgi:hypothetical protein
MMVRVPPPPQRTRDPRTALAGAARSSRRRVPTPPATFLPIPAGLAKQSRLAIAFDPKVRHFRLLANSALCHPGFTSPTRKALEALRLVRAKSEVPDFSQAMCLAQRLQHC